MKVASEMVLVVMQGEAVWSRSVIPDTKPMCNTHTYTVHHHHLCLDTWLGSGVCPIQMAHFHGGGFLTATGRGIQAQLLGATSGCDIQAQQEQQQQQQHQQPS